MHDVLTTSEAVRCFSMHPATVLRLILTGRVTAQKDTNGHWLIDRDSLERWNRNRQRRAQQPEREQVCAEHDRKLTQPEGDFQLTP